MKKSDLRSGMIVQLRNGSRYMFLEETQNLSGEQYGYNITDFNEDLTHKYYSDKDIIKVYRPRKNGCILNVINNSDELIWERKDYCLTKREFEVLEALRTLGHEWLARDKNGELFSYIPKPHKLNTIWRSSIVFNNLTRVDEDLFTFIKWEDKEPTNIKELLK